MFEIHDLDEQRRQQMQSDSIRVEKVESALIALNKRITEMECPRDDSFDNSIVVWLSTAFSSKSAQQDLAATALHDGTSTSTGSETSVSVLCSGLEDLGMTVRRCGDSEEAVTKSRDLKLVGQLRCVVMGGYERGDDSSKAAANKINFLSCVKTLMDKESAYGRKYGSLDAARIAVYSAYSHMKEEEQMDLWSRGVTVTDDPVQILSWAANIPPWASDVDEPCADLSSQGNASDPLYRAVHVPLRSIQPCETSSLLVLARQHLEELEREKSIALEEEEKNRTKWQTTLAEKHNKLNASVERRISELNAASNELSLILKSGKVAGDPTVHTSYKIGPHCGRDAALALAWLDEYQASVTHSEVPHPDFRSTQPIHKHLKALRNEVCCLKQMILATKVITNVTSPLQKKLLNLCHHWLVTFLPHCLAKVNRVSFGLLSEQDCQAALAVDPNVPRSRLKLAVPFVGKDVPSQSSEFAHPDVIIGLTVMAYR